MLLGARSCGTVGAACARSMGHGRAGGGTGHHLLAQRAVRIAEVGQQAVARARRRARPRRAARAGGGQAPPGPAGRQAPRGRGRGRPAQRQPPTLPVRQRCAKRRSEWARRVWRVEPRACPSKLQHTDGEG